MLYQVDGLRVLVYDRDADPAVLPFLWQVGGKLIGRFDRILPAKDWEDAYLQLATEVPEQRIDELQFWSHGRRGDPVFGKQDIDCHKLKAALGYRIDPESLVWFRACDVFGGERGHAFASLISSVLGCNIAGHTHIISLGRLLHFEVPSIWQSGGHILPPGVDPYWDVEEGVGEGGASTVSGMFLPGTCSIFAQTPPEHFWREAEQRHNVTERLKRGRS